MERRTCLDEKGQEHTKVILSKNTMQLSSLLFITKRLNRNSNQYRPI